MDCILLNLSKAPFNNLKLRQATAIAVSSAQYVEVIDQGRERHRPTAPSSRVPVLRGRQQLSRVQPCQGQVRWSSRWPRRPGSRWPSPSTTSPTPTPPGSPSTSSSSSQTVGMKVTLAPVQQADIINTALLGTFEAQVWRQFGAVDPDLNYIFWSPTNASTPVFAINMARNTDPNMRDGPAQGAPVPGPVRPDRRLPGGEQAPGPGHPLRLDRPGRLGRRPPSPRCRTSTTRPPRPGARRLRHDRRVDLAHPDLAQLLNRHDPACCR